MRRKKLTELREKRKDETSLVAQVLRRPEVQRKMVDGSIHLVSQRRRMEKGLCPSCGADRKTITESGHFWTSRDGHFIRPPGTPDCLPCPEACTCIPECFSMKEHREKWGEL